VSDLTTIILQVRFDIVGEAMRLSYSSISAYRNCPLKYRFSYVERRPALPSPALSFGSSVHEALRWFYCSPTAEPPALPDLLDYLEECWVSDGYSGPEEEARYFYQARSTLELFHRNNVAEFSMPLALEEHFVIDLGFCELSGVIDRLHRRPDGSFEIIDYKTNRRLPPARRLHEDLQMPIYQMAAERVWEVSPGEVTFYYLLLNHRFSFHVTRERKDAALAEIESVVSCIDRGLFDPRENPLCPWCDHQEVCPQWEGRPLKKRSLEPPAMEVGQAVDELLVSGKRVSDMLGRMEGLKQIVRSYMESRGVDRVAGGRGIASLGPDGDLSWDEEGGRPGALDPDEG